MGAREHADAVTGILWQETGVRAAGGLAKQRMAGGNFAQSLGEEKLSCGTGLNGTVLLEAQTGSLDGFSCQAPGYPRFGGHP